MRGDGWEGVRRAAVESRACHACHACRACRSCVPYRRQLLRGPPPSSPGRRTWYCLRTSWRTSGSAATSVAAMCTPPLRTCSALPKPPAAATNSSACARGSTCGAGEEERGERRADARVERQAARRGQRRRPQTLAKGAQTETEQQALKSTLERSTLPLLSPGDPWGCASCTRHPRSPPAAPRSAPGPPPSRPGRPAGTGHTSTPWRAGAGRRRRRARGRQTRRRRLLRRRPRGRAAGPSAGTWPQHRPAPVEMRSSQEFRC